MCGKFEMSWFDYMNNQFKCDGVIYRLYKNNTHIKLYTNFLFILNMHKPNYVCVEDIIDFIYHDIDINKWPDDPNNILKVVKYRLQKTFTYQFEIISNCFHCYKLAD